MGKSGIKNEETRKKIGEKKKENWQNPEIAKKMKLGLNKATAVWQEQCKEKRISLICKTCNKTFFVPPYLAKKRIFCSVECFNNFPKNAPLKAIERLKEIKEERYSNIKKESEAWARENKEIIKKCPYNKISTNLMEIFEIANKYDIFDWRTISLAICNNPSRKELLKYLKSL